MISLPQTIGIGALTLLATVAAQAGIGGAQDKGFACGIAATAQKGMLTLEGTVLSPAALEGSYRFSLRSSGGGGNSDISQGGVFSAQPNQPALLGRMAINAGANYEAVLELETGGKRIVCMDEIARL